MRERIIIVLLAIFPALVLGQSWETLGNGTNGTVRSLYADSVTGKLFVAGTFNRAGDSVSRGIATWNGNAWDSLGKGIDPYLVATVPSPTDAIFRYGNDVFVGGAFDHVGDSVVAHSIARWDGTTWHNAGDANSSVLDFMLYDSMLLAVGFFDTIGGIAAHRMALYDGVQWMPFYDDPIDLLGIWHVYDAIEYQDQLYITGNFSQVDSLKEIMRWDGNNWLSVGGGIKGDAWVNDTEVFQGELYVGGHFFEQDGNEGSFIMSWNGERWRSIGGPDWFVTDMLVWHDALWVAGAFSSVDGIPAQFIARWDGQQWCMLDDVFDNKISHLAIYQDELIAAAAFDSINEQPFNNIARWVDHSWADTCSAPLGIEDNITSSQSDELLVYPTPAQNWITVSEAGPAAQYVLYDLYGQVVLRSRAASFSVAKLAVGPYILMDEKSRKRTLIVKQ